MVKKAQEVKKEFETMQVQMGNTEFLKVKLLSDISMYLKRIAEALEK